MRGIATVKQVCGKVYRCKGYEAGRQVLCQKRLCYAVTLLMIFRVF